MEQVHEAGGKETWTLLRGHQVFLSHVALDRCTS